MRSWPRRLAAALLAISLSAGFGAMAWRHSRMEQLARDGLLAVEQRDVGRMLAAAEALEHVEGYESHVRLFQGAFLFSSGDVPGALATLRTVKAQGELRRPALMMIGEAYYRIGRKAEAARVFRVLASEQPDLPEPHRWLATLYHDMGAMHAALEELQTVARLQPADFFPYRLMALLYKEDLEEELTAIEHYRKALDLKPPAEHRNAILQELAQALMRQRDYQGALEALEQADPAPVVQGLQAECCWSLGDRTRTRELLAQAQTADPDIPQVLRLAGRIHLDQGRPAEAIAVLTRALELDRHDHQSRYQLALAYQRIGDSARSEQEMTRMKESKALREELRTLYLRAMRQPADAAIRRQIADVCRRLGKEELARTWMQAAEVCQQLSGPPTFVANQ